MTRIETKVVQEDHGNDPTGAISYPIYQTATFRHPALNKTTGYDYTRTQNPTREVLEKKIASLEQGEFASAFSSGMSAIAVILQIFSPGDHFVVSEDLYGGTYRLFDDLQKYGLKFSFTDTSCINSIEKEIQENTRAFFIETPSNPMMRVSDIEKICQIAKKKKILCIIDNTFLTPYFQRPLELGADIVIHSGTKFLGGHNDTLAGFLVVNDKKLDERIKFVQNSFGAVLAPFDSWLILRGLKTLGIRLERQEQNALQIAKWLKDTQLIEQVYYVGLEEHPAYEISKKQSSGFGSMISFRVKEEMMVEKIINQVKLIAYAESLGGVESLITYPYLQTHAAIPEAIREKVGVDKRLLRLSVGIEAVEDIIADLKQAMI